MDRALPARTRRAIAAGCLIAFATAARAQSVLGNDANANAPTVGAIAPTTRTNVPPAASTAVALPPFYQAGPFAFRPHFDFSRAYATGVQSAPGRPLTTYIDTFQLGVGVAAGRTWLIDYQCSWLRYSRRDFRNSFGQQLVVSGRASGHDWAVAFGQRYSDTDLPVVETARQTKQQNSTSTVTVSRSLSPHLQATITGEQKLTFTEAFADNYEWSIRPGIDYEATDTLSVGADVGSGYILVYHASDVRYNRPAAHVSWQLTNKTAVAAAVGYDEWKFVAQGRGKVTGPYAQLSAIWQPFTFTTLSLTGQKSNTVTPFRNQAAEAKSWDLNLTQRLLQHFSLHLGAGGQQTQYVLAGPTISAVRSDRIRNYSARLATTFLRRGTASVYYRYAKDASNLGAFGFTSRQYGVQIGFRY